MNEYVIKYKDSSLYVEKMDSKSYSLTYFLDNAKKYSKAEAEKICIKDEFKCVTYAEENYKFMDEAYKTYVNAIVLTESDINKNDLIPLIENKNNELKKDMIYLELQEKYPNSKLLDEMYRIIWNIEKVEKSIIDFDYDYIRQKEILVDAFNEKYLTDDLVEESEVL